MNRTLEIGGLNIKARVSKIATIPSDRNMIHFEWLPNGSTRILATRDMFPDISAVTEFKVIRDGDERFIELVGTNQRIQLVTSTCLTVQHNFIHLDEIAPNEWRLSYPSGLIPDFTKVTSLIIHSEEDVL